MKFDWCDLLLVGAMAGLLGFLVGRALRQTTPDPADWWKRGELPPEHCDD